MPIDQPLSATSCCTLNLDFAFFTSFSHFDLPFGKSLAAYFFFFSFPVQKRITKVVIVWTNPYLFDGFKYKYLTHFNVHECIVHI